MSRGSASPPQELWTSSHITPTVADVELAPRRRLRDGSEAVTNASRLGKRGRSARSHDSHSGRSGSAASSTGTNGQDAQAIASSSHTNVNNSNSIGTDLAFPFASSSRSSSTPTASSSMNGTSSRVRSARLQTGAEASRRLPRLHTRVRQAPSSDDELDESDDNDESDNGDEGQVDVKEEEDTVPELQDGTSSSRGVDNRADRSPRSRAAPSSNGTALEPITISDDESDDEEDIPLARDMAARRNSRTSSSGNHSPAKRRAPASASSASPQRRPAPRSPSDSTEPGERRFTTAEKGKGRAAPPSSPSPSTSTDSDIDLNLDTGTSMDDSVQFLDATAAPDVKPDDEPEAVIDADSTLSAYTCPVCFCAPTNPAFTPCGHVLCYGCLHSSLLAAVQRQLNPFPNIHDLRRDNPRSRGRGRGRGRPAPVPREQPASWDVTSLREAANADRFERVSREVQASGIAPGDAPAAIAAATEGDIQIEHPLEHLWKVDDKWIIEGECPVCRKAIAGGLGPLGSGIGGVTVIETRVA